MFIDVHTDVWNRLPPHIVTVDTVASFVKGINSLRAHFLVPDFDYSIHIVHFCGCKCFL